ncbi:hypothetical protein [Bradyrhizobium elkanii]|uniref:hypothetical protein n=1 Tax=Bradyrhizobium elkanii TaxID=29448 RepID=UPI003515B8EC
MGKRVWQRLWKTWTIDKPAALGDWLWQILVVELAALLDRLTLRKLIALIPVAIVIGAYWHRIPLPPELMLVGDVLAYIDIFSMIFLIGFFTRVATVVAVVRQAIDFVRGGDGACADGAAQIWRSSSSCQGQSAPQAAHACQDG